MAPTQNDYIIILHGIFRTRVHMRKLAAYLSSRGYDVISLNYPSTRLPLEELVHTIRRDIEAQLKTDKPVHLVGYSMGGLLLRAILNGWRPATLGRVVQLAAPNHGSEVTDTIKNLWLYRKLYGKAGQQLGTDQAAIAHLFGAVDYELGIIAGDRCLDPICAFMLPKPHDGKVSVASTTLEGMKDHIVVNATHTWFPHNKEVQRQTAYFLENGKFLH